DQRVMAVDVRNLPDCVLAGPQPSRNRLVDDYHRLRLRPVVPSKIAALDETHSNRLEVAGRNDVDKGSLQLSPLIRLALGRNSPTPVAAQWQVVGKPRGLHSRNRLYAVKQALPQCTARIGIVVIVDVHLDRGCTARLKAEVNIQHAQKTAQ